MHVHTETHTRINTLEHKVPKYLNSDAFVRISHRRGRGNKETRPVTAVMNQLTQAVCIVTGQWAVVKGQGSRGLRLLSFISSVSGQIKELVKGTTRGAEGDIQDILSNGTYSSSAQPEPFFLPHGIPCPPLFCLIGPE